MNELLNFQLNVNQMNLKMIDAKCDMKTQMYKIVANLCQLLFVLYVQQMKMSTR